MEFSILGAVVAGLVATVIMSLMIKMATSMELTQMPPFPLMTGSMVSGDDDVAKKVGFVVHYPMMGTVVFGLLYAGAFAVLGTASLLAGLVIGVVHALVVGAIAMPMMPVMHPRMGKSPARQSASRPMHTGKVQAGAPSVSHEDGELRISSPGFFGVNWGKMTPVGVIMGHVVYALVFTVVYQAFI